MLDIVRKCEPLCNFYWEIRQLLQLSSKSFSETIYRIKKNISLEEPQGPGVFNFSWGAFRYTSVNSLIGQYQEIFEARHYSFECDTQNPRILDCGGNMGLSAIWFALNYPDCRLVVFEPDENLAEIIATNIKNAGIKACSIVNKAVWFYEGRISFSKSGDDKGRVDPLSEVTVECVDLNSYLEQPIDLLKLDIEGAEFEIIRHLCESKAIAKVKRIVCECHIIREETSKLTRMVDSLLDAGFNISFNAGRAVPWLGLSHENSPFEIIGQNNVSIQLYAWQRNC
jgi:FkbM family methyltransferase